MLHGEAQIAVVHLVSGARQTAQQILSATGVQGGMVVHVGCGDGALTAALGLGQGYLVQGLDVDAADVKQARRRFRSLGLQGRVSADRFDGKRLPYIDNMLNLIVVSESRDLSSDEITRALAPRGVAYVKQEGQWIKTIKPVPEAIDDWTHSLYDLYVLSLA